MSATANIVSRTLAAAGERPLPSGTSRMREGIRVSSYGGGRVAVAVDQDNDREATARADDLVSILEDAGYTVERQRPTYLVVSR